jgi:high affinity Mn2+ porin
MFVSDWMGLLALFCFVGTLGGGVKRLLVCSATLIALTVGDDLAGAADRPVAPPVKPPIKPTAYDWTGFYVGGHFGYGWGRSDWAANGHGALAPALIGSLDFFNAFDFFKGTGSYVSGLQAGYDYMFPSRLVLGVEADVSFPNSIGKTQAVSSPSIGQASYSEMVQYSGTVRGRFGYGLARTYNQFSREQLVGPPAAGSAVPGSVESFFMVPRVGWAAGGGVEFLLASDWTARLEYLFTVAAQGNLSFCAPTSSIRLNEVLASEESCRKLCCIAPLLFRGAGLFLSRV